MQGTPRKPEKSRRKSSHKSISIDQNNANSSVEVKAEDTNTIDSVNTKIKEISEKINKADLIDIKKETDLNHKKDYNKLDNKRIFKKDNKNKKPFSYKKTFVIGGPKNKQTEYSIWNILFAVIITLIVVKGVSYVSDDAVKPTEVSLSVIAQDLSGTTTSKLEVEGDTVIATYKDGSQKTAKKESNVSLVETLDTYGINLDKKKDIEYLVKQPSGAGYWLLNILPFIIPLLMVGLFVWLLTRQAKGQGMQAISFGRSRARITDPNDERQKVTFNDVAGNKEAKQELMEIVEFLKFPKKFIDIGAQIPKGVLLMGGPGTGKTLLARAVAGEANVPFFSISGSEFVEMFVGVGASRVRDLFEMAKRVAPAIIFVDEIDAVGRVRGGGMGGGNDEREQTLNQILVEMDGFAPNEKVIIMAATNRPDVLDPALLRPGRFDRRVTLDLPDLEDRIAILKIQAKNKPLAEGVNLKKIAERTPGFSGAEIYSLVNEAAILAARHDRTTIEQIDFINAIEKVILGPERSSHLLLDKEKKITAYHEAGHALVASILPYTDPVHKISIVSRGRAAGYVLHLPIEEKKFKTKKEMIDDMAVMLAGYATEKLVFDDLTTGPSNDLEVATARARDMVTKYGMSEKIGPIALANEVGKPLFGAISQGDEYSERVTAEVDSEISRILHEAEQTAHKTITEHRALLDIIAERLIAEETIEREGFELILEENGIVPKRAKEALVEAGEKTGK